MVINGLQSQETTMIYLVTISRKQKKQYRKGRGEREKPKKIKSSLSGFAIFDFM